MLVEVDIRNQFDDTEATLQFTEDIVEWELMLLVQWLEDNDFEVVGNEL